MNGSGLECLVEYGVCDEHSDSFAASLFDGKLQMVGGAIQTITKSNIHHVYNLSGTRLYAYEAPFTPDTEMLSSLVVSGKLTIIGSDEQHIWQFDPSIAGYTAGSWSEITADYTPSIGVRTAAWGCDLGGWFYLGGGWGGTDVVKTQDFLNWTVVGSLPAPLSRLSGCASVVHNGLIHVIGGATRLASPYGLAEYYAAESLGHHYTFDGSTWTFIETDAAKFGTIWCDAASDGENIWFNPGKLPGTTKNQRYPYKSADDGATWTQITEINDGMAWFQEAHRRGAVSTNGAAYFLGGSFANGLWKMTP